MTLYTRAISSRGMGTLDDPMRFIASTANIDRAGDVVEQSWSFDEYRLNPVFLWCHDYYHPPIGRCAMADVMPAEQALAGHDMAPADIGLDPGDDVLVMDIVFDQDDEFAADICRKYVERIMNCVSVGFRCEEVSSVEDTGGMRFERNVLYELSATPIPMNAGAVAARGADPLTSPITPDERRMLDWMTRIGEAPLPMGERTRRITRATDFPTEGDDQKVSLRNSGYDVFDREFIDTIKSDWPQIWEAGGNTKGDDQYRRLRPVVMRGGAVETDTEDTAVRDREAWAARHFKNFRLAGVVALAKWFVVGEIGEQKMKDVMNEAKERFKTMTPAQIEAALVLMRGEDGLDLGDACDEAIRLLDEEARAEDERMGVMRMECTKGAAKQLDPLMSALRKMAEEDRAAEVMIDGVEMTFDARGPGCRMGEMTYDDKGDEERAEPGDLAVGDFVTWNSSGGMSQGAIERIEDDGEIDVPGSDFTISGTPEDPAALIRVYEEDDDGWEPTDVQVGHLFSALTKIDPLPAPTDDDEVEQAGLAPDEDDVILIVIDED